MSFIKRKLCVNMVIVSFLCINCFLVALHLLSIIPRLATFITNIMLQTYDW